MEASSIAAKKEELIAASSEVLEYVSEEEQINSLLDNILNMTKHLDKINDLYQRVFGLIDGLSFELSTNTQEHSAVKEILDSLSYLKNSSGKLFATLSHQDLLRSGCKSALLDFRINIRNLSETINDLEERYFLQEEDEKLNELLSEFEL